MQDVKAQTYYSSTPAIMLDRAQESEDLVVFGRKANGELTLWSTKDETKTAELIRAFAPTVAGLLEPQPRQHQGA